MNQIFFYEQGKRRTSYEPEYTAYLSRLTVLGITEPDTFTKTRQNEAVKQLKLNGIWSKIASLKFVWNSSLNAMLVDVKSPSTMQGTIIGTGYAFTPNGGIAFNNTDAYVALGFNAALTGGGIFTQDNAGLLYYLKTPGVSTAGLGNAASNDLWLTHHSNSGNTRINAAGNPSTSTNMSGVGLKAAYRDDANNIRIFNGLTKNNSTQLSRALRNIEMWLGANGGSLSDNAYNGIVAFTSSLSDSEHSIIVTINANLIA